MGTASKNMVEKYLMLVRKPRLGVGLHGLREKCHPFRSLNYVKHRLYKRLFFLDDSKSCRGLELVGFLQKPCAKNPVKYIPLKTMGNFSALLHVTSIFSHSLGMGGFRDPSSFP